MYKESFYDKYIQYSFIGTFIDKVHTVYYNIKYGILNLIKWFPIIVKDRDWDYSFLVILIRFKLEQMADLHKNYGHCVNSHVYVDQLNKTAKALKRIEEDTYIEQEDNVFNRNPKYLNKPNKVNLFSDYMRQQDLDYALKLISKHLYDWWD